MGIRVTDLMMSGSYLTTINKTKNKISELSEEVATGEKIQSPSDDPIGTAKLLALNKRYADCETYINNIDEASAFVNESITAMESMETEVTDALSMLTEISSLSEDSSLTSYAEELDSVINSLLSLANTESNGKYLFGGTDYSEMPYALSSDGDSVCCQVDASGQTTVKITNNSSIKINTTGADLFNTIVEQSGNISSATTVGGTVTSQTTVYDGSGNEYTLNLTYTKTAADKYDLTYTVNDSSGTTVYTSASAASLKFDSTSGKLLTVDGEESTSLNIYIEDSNINFTLDLENTTETSSASSLSYSANQERDIFSTLIAIRNNLANGVTPSDEDIAVVEDFYNNLLDAEAKAGNTINQLDNTETFLESRETMLTDLIANVNEVDTTEAALELETQQTVLELSYQMASSTLTMSLLDYL